MKKKIIAIVVVICLLVTGFFGYQFYKNKKAGEESANNETEQSQPEEIEEISFVPVSEEDALSEAQWMKLLNESFDFTDYTEYSDEKINGSYAVYTGLHKLGGACLSYYLDDKEVSEENCNTLALDKGLIDHDYIDSYIGQEQAEELIQNLKLLQQQEDYHIEKNEVNLAEGVVDGQQWIVDYYNHVEDSESENPVQDEVIAATGDYEPQIDDRIVYLDEYGIMHGGRVIGVETSNEGKYDILTVPVDTQEDLINNYTVAGYLDWSQIQEYTDEAAFIDPVASLCKTADDQAAISTDIIIKGVASTDKHNHLNITGVSVGGIPIYERFIYKDDEDDEDEGNQKTLSGDFSIALEDVKIYVYAEDDQDVSVELSFNPEVKIDGLSVGAELPLPSLPFALGAFQGSLDIAVIVNADLGISIGFSSTNPVCISTNTDTTGSSSTTNSNEVDCQLNEKDFNDFADIDRDEFSISAGVNMGLELKLCEVIHVIKPNFTVSFVAVGKQLDSVEGYEQSCYEIKIAGPLAEVSLSEEGTLVDYFLALANVSGSKQLIGINDDEHLLVAKYFHLEFNPINMLIDPNGNASVCTHYATNEDHLEDEKIQFSYGSDYSYDKDADYFIEINGEIFGFQFTNEEYEQQYLDYLDNISKEDIMSPNTQFSETDYIVNNDEFFQLPSEEKYNYHMIMPGELCVIHGDDISNIRIARFITSVFGVAYLNSGYVYGEVVGSVTYADQERYKDTLLNIGNNSFSFRKPYRNMEKTTQQEE